jgi:hypothetical protein
MKNALTTTALATFLSIGAFGAASAMPAAAPATGAAAGTPVELVHYRGPGAYRGHHRVLPRHVIVRSLRHRGFRHIRDVRRVRGDYVVHARGYRGPVRLVVDGRTARILSRQPLYRHGHQPGVRFQGSNGNFTYSFGIY